MAKDNSKRRKRKELSFPLVPEGERFFLGMTFYSIPPDDASDIRRLRIAKARSFGAIWTKEWIPGVITHVVIEKGLTYEDVIKWFKSEHKIEVLPSSIFMVNVNYFSDCFAYKHFLDPDQPQYRVGGRESTAKQPKLRQTISQPSGGTHKMKQERRGELEDNYQPPTPYPEVTTKQPNILQAIRQLPGESHKPKRKRHSEIDVDYQSPTPSRESTPEHPALPGIVGLVPNVAEEAETGRPVGNTKDSSSTTEKPLWTIASGSGDDLEEMIKTARKLEYLVSGSGNDLREMIKTARKLEHLASETARRLEDLASCSGDDLDEVIETVKKLEYLPLDETDEEEEEESSQSRRSESERFVKYLPLDETDNRGEESDQSGSEGERERACALQRKKQQKSSSAIKKAPFNQKSFSCMKGGTGITLESNPNRRTIEILQQMADYYDRTRDIWRVRAYRRAVGALKKQDTKIATYEEAKALPAIGHRLAEKIQEIVHTDRLRRLENALLEPNDKILALFLGIYGVGTSQAQGWIQSGCKTLNDLKANVSLTANQRTGIEHYSDFTTRIPREEVTALGEIVKETSAEIDISIQVIIAGSYRRGAASCGDIDCLITKPGTSSSREILPFLHKLVARLTDIGFLVAALAVPRNADGTKWHGACVFPGGTPNAVWRRIDLLLVPASELGAALIYFTGDDLFNRSLRLLASKKGWRLNQRGLYKDVMRGPGRVKITEGTLIESENEGKIFEAMGVPWRKPEDRVLH